MFLTFQALMNSIIGALEMQLHANLAPQALMKAYASDIISAFNPRRRTAICVGEVEDKAVTSRTGAV
jgi:hypothetical protein